MTFITPVYYRRCVTPLCSMQQSPWKDKRFSASQ